MKTTLFMTCCEKYPEKTIHIIIPDPILNETVVLHGGNQCLSVLVSIKNDVPADRQTSSQRRFVSTV